MNKKQLNKIKDNLADPFGIKRSSPPPQDRYDSLLEKFSNSTPSHNMRPSQTERETHEVRPTQDLPVSHAVRQLHELPPSQDATVAQQTTLAQYAPAPQQPVPAPLAPNATIAQRATVAPYIEPREGYFKARNEVSDKGQSILEPFEFSVWFRLYRLSHGFKKTTTPPVGYNAIAKACNMSLRKVQYVAPQLVQKGWIRVVEVLNGSNPADRGTIYEVFLESTIAQNATVAQQTPVAAGAAVARGTSNKHDHDDSKIHDHHQTDVMRIYEELSGLSWGTADSASYDQVKHLQVDQIVQMMRTIHARRGTQPGSFAFYTTGILKDLQSKRVPAPRSGARKKLQTWVDELRELHVGDPNRQPSDLVADLKDRCAREGISWDNDLVNEVLGE
jgi:hypothetical protein